MKIRKSNHAPIFVSERKNKKDKQVKVQEKQLKKWTPLEIQVQPKNDQTLKGIPENPDKPDATNKSSNKRPVSKPPPEPIVVQRNNNKSQPLRASEVSKELLRISGSWPFDLAPDELIIEEKRIIIKRNNFPVGGSVITVPFEKLVSFEVNHAVLYSAIYIKSEGDTVNTVMQWLNPPDAIRAKEVVDGLRLKESSSIEIKEKSKDKVVQTLQSIGHT